MSDTEFLYTALANLARLSFFVIVLLGAWLWNKQQNQWASLEEEHTDVELPTVDEMLADDAARDRGLETIRIVGFENDSKATTQKAKELYSEIFVTRADGGVQTLERAHRSVDFDVERQERAKALAARLGVEYFEI